MGKLYSGSSEIKKAFYGNTSIKAIYYGSVKIYPNEIYLDDPIIEQIEVRGRDLDCEVLNVNDVTVEVWFVYYYDDSSGDSYDSQDDAPAIYGGTIAPNSTGWIGFSTNTGASIDYADIGCWFVYENVTSGETWESW